MPLNEAASLRRHGLTRQQQKEQLAAIYGLKEPIMTSQLSPEEVERMRQIVASHDASSPSRGIKEFDLAKPPTEQYRHKEYPRAMYHHVTGATKTAHTEDQADALEAKGWSKTPPPSADAASDGPELDDEAIAEAAAIDKQLKKKKSA